MRHTAETLTGAARARFLRDGQRWYDQWEQEGRPYSDENVERLYDLGGMGQSLGLAASLKGTGKSGDLRIAHRLVDLAVEEASDIEAEWAEAHDGEQYHSFGSLVTFMEWDIQRNGMFSEGRDAPVDMALCNPVTIASAFFLKGSLMYDLGSYDESIEWHRRALRVEPTYSAALLEIAECHKKLGSFEEGRSVAREALELVWQLPLAAKARRTIAFFEGELGNYDEAAANLVIAGDYEQSMAVAHEILWLREQGWTGTMDLVTALRIAPEHRESLADGSDELDGSALSPLAVEAMMLAMNLIRQMPGPNEDALATLHEVMKNLATATRGGRKALMAKESELGRP